MTKIHVIQYHKTKDVTPTLNANQTKSVHLIKVTFCQKLVVPQKDQTF